ncbi:steroid receptor RNA activator 1 [Glossina fuscipes]|uniref:Steroid receptor RNA activator 1 n=2 Tax=Nemorhina TaxID=44051 RepID=A0A9C5YZZ1_9MUSC|nr:steroid receptor RNA activator 1 [Glossina fuscipes]KAI9581883.1 hypothetical protein GQX74_011378 [Glossina fuscipes]
MADKLPSAMPSASEPFPGSRTPGWNDPPTLEFNPVSARPGNQRTRLNLHKRAAFPLQGIGSGELSGGKPTAIVTPQANCGFPPPPPPPMSSVSASHPIAVVHPMPHANLTSLNTAGEQETLNLPGNATTAIFRTLRDQIGSVQESISVRREDIERRLSIIERLWQTGNLCVEVKQKIYDLSRAVARKQYTEAMEIYTTLVANHANECASWAITLRHIILTVEHENVVSDSNILSNAPNVPTMLVPAMPRTNNSQSSDASTAATHRVRQ